MLAAPVLVQLSVLLDPALTLAGLALNDVIVGAEPVGGEADVVPEVVAGPESFDDPPQLVRTAHASSMSASARAAGLEETRAHST